jgi:hypothetical protein
MNEFDTKVVNPTGKKSLTELANPQRRNLLLSTAISALFASQDVLSHGVTQLMVMEKISHQMSLIVF